MVQGALVDPSLVDLKSLGDEVRFRIFDSCEARVLGAQS
jgi:hypothetical protein